MSKKSRSTLKLGAAAAILAAGLGVSGITSEAVFDAPYYDITKDGGSFNGSQYVLNGATITDSFFCDGTYTYFLQTDGTPMKDRLTYHPDGEQVIYFDANGHECFDTFAHVKKSIAGDDVDDLCYFGTTGNLYVNVITYNREGTAIYYANGKGVMERNGVFEVSSDAVNYDALAKGCKYGYANSDGTVKGFYATYEEAAAGQANGNSGNNNADQKKGYWQEFGTITYDGNGKQISRRVWEGDNYMTYVTDDRVGEYLSIEGTNYYDSDGEYYGYIQKNYSLKSDGTTYLEFVVNSQRPENGNWVYQSTGYDEDGQIREETVRTYNGSDILKEVECLYREDGKEEIVTVYNYENGKLVSSECNDVSTYTYDGTDSTSKTRTVTDYTANKNKKRQVVYKTDENGVEKASSYIEWTYTTVAGEEVMARADDYLIISNNSVLVGYSLFTYDENANQTSHYYYQLTDDEFKFYTGSESTYSYIKNSWVCTRYLYYENNNGEKVPVNGYDYFYENNELSQYNRYTGTEDGNWTLKEYTTYNNNYNFPQDTSQIVTFDYSRTYDANGNLKRYTVEYWCFVQK